GEQALVQILFAALDAFGAAVDPHTTGHVLRLWDPLGEPGPCRAADRWPCRRGRGGPARIRGRPPVDGSTTAGTRPGTADGRRRGGRAARSGARCVRSTRLAEVEPPMAAEPDRKSTRL